MVVRFHIENLIQINETDFQKVLELNLVENNSNYTYVGYSSSNSSSSILTLCCY